jgi:rsbT co-antagonist protein RsbR
MISWFNNARIRTKILVCAIAILVIVGAMSGVVYAGIVASQGRDRLVVRANTIVASTDKLMLQVSNMELDYRTYLLTGDKAGLKPYETNYLTYTQELANLQEVLSSDPVQTERLRQIDTAVVAWRTYTHQAGIKTRARLGKKPSAAFDAYTITGYRSKQDYDHIRNQLIALRDIEIAHAEERQSEAQTTALQLRVTLLVGTLVVSLLCLGALSLLASNIARRVGRVTLAAQRIASGDGTVRCDVVGSQDEVGLMATTFNAMADIIQERSDDLQAQYTEVEAARCAAEAGRAQIAEQLALIDQQQAVIRDMSVPILPLLASTFVMPLVGALDSNRLALMQEQALQTLERSSARHLILDITGVPIVDTQVALGLTQLVQAAGLLGTRVSIVGIRPEVAQAIVGLGINLSQISTFSTLQRGIAHAFAAQAAAETQPSQRDSRQPSQAANPAALTTLRASAR